MQHWVGWLESQTQYVSIDAQGYVTWVKDADAAAFAKAALAHARREQRLRLSDAKTADSATVAFTGLNLGYYLVDTTLGTLCSLDTQLGHRMWRWRRRTSSSLSVTKGSAGRFRRIRGEDGNTAEIGDSR